MPIVFIVFLAMALGLATAAAVVFWPQVIGWAHDVLFPWFARHLPALEDVVRDAFRAIDKVATPLLRLVRAAWEKVRPHLLKLVVNIYRNTTDGSYVRRVTTYLQEALRSKQVRRLVMEEDVAYEDLSADVRDELLRRGQMDIDVREYRTKELEMMTEGG